MDDLRVRAVLDLIETGRYDLLSLDLFDTLVWRKVPRPTDVFYLVAHRLRAQGWMRPSSSPESFTHERIQAEQRARRRKPSLEVTLEEIYDEFPRGYLEEISPRDAAEVEFETERDLIRVNPDMQELVDRARAKGLRIAFVSDTYFTAERIRRLVPIAPDYLLLSCEENVGKYQGLHQRLIERSGVEPGRILHVGDDYRADVEGPGIFSMDRYWFRLWPESFEDLLSQELPSTFSGRASYLDGDDAGLTTLRTRAVARSTNPYERWGSAVLGPVVAGFTDWVADRCKALQTDTVLCLMREGRVFKQALDRLHPGLTTREFYVSRYAARKAAIFDASEEELLAFVLRPSPQKRGTILRQLGLDEDALDGDPDETLSPDETRTLIHHVHADRSLRRRVIRDSARARAGLLAHLRSVLGGDPPARLALVDLGYKGTIQECLQRIFDREGTGVTTRGLYLVTGGKVYETQATGASVEGWLAENGQPIAMSHTFMRSPEVFEQSLMAPCGTTLGHTPQGEPVLDDFHIPPRQRDQIAAVQRGLITYVDLWREHKDACGIRDAARLDKFYRAICIRAVARPLPVEIELFGDWVHDENFGSGHARTLTSVDGLDEWELAHLSPHQLASLPMSRVHWPFAFARKISPAMGEAVTNIFLRTVEPEVFDFAGDPQVMAVYWDTGKGFRKEQALVQPYRLNNRGNVWQRFTLRLDEKGPRPRRIGLSIGTRDQVIRLTGIALRASTGNGEEKTVRIPHDAVEKAGYHPVHGNLYLVTEDPPLLTVPVNGIGEGAKTVHVDVFFGVVPGE